VDVSWGDWMLSVIFRDEVWCLDIRGYFPRVVLSAETFPLNQELKPPLVLLGNHSKAITPQAR